MESGIQYQELLHYPQGSKFISQGGNLIMMPTASLEAQSPTDLSEHITTQIITPEQLQQAAAIESNRAPIRETGRENDMNNGLDLGGVDESLTDLQPADSDGEEDLDALWSRKRLTQEQKKLEFMAAVNLVPPAVLEDIQRRQKLCRAEYGNWWDRQHSTDFCLVPKTRTLQNQLNRRSPEGSDYVDQAYPLVVGEDQTQVAAGPDAESTVEQITYLTSWPASSSPTPSSSHHTSVDVISMPTTTMSMLSAAPVQHQVLEQRTAGEESYQVAFQPVKDYRCHR